MKFLCGSCRTKYQISGEKVRGKILTIRCKKCGAKILVRESLGREAAGGTAVAPVAEDEQIEERTIAANARSGGSATLSSAYDVVMGSTETEDMPTSIAPVPANLERAGAEWYVAIDGVQQGPFAFGELVRRVGTKEVQGRHYVWHDGMDNWQRARDVSDLAPHFPQKKKPPPPPMPVTGGAEPSSSAGAEVVDFASKRAERQKNLGASVVEPIAPSETDATALDSAKAVAPSEPGGPNAERAEQLDKVLNEALGIQNEGKTARAEPQKASAAAAPLLSAAGLPPAAKSAPPSIDDLLAFDQHGDDIFANVPRAADEAVQKESTRFFVAAAGVNRQRSRNKLGLVAGGVGVLAVVAFVGAWASGVIAISIPGIGNPFHNAHAKAAEEEFEDLGPEDPTQFKGLDGEQQRAARAAAAKRRAAARKSTGSPTSPGGDYIADNTSSGGTGGPRGDNEVGSVAIGTELGAGGAPGAIPEPVLPRSDVQLPTLETGGSLSEAQIADVINSRKKSVMICYDQSLRGARDDLRGKLEIAVTIEPTGSVSKATVETSQFKGSKLGECIAQKIKDWRFPAFQGLSQKVVVPFVLEKGY